MKLNIQAGRRDKIHILIDGEYKITTTADFWNKCPYNDGCDITDEDFAQLSDKINYAKALRKCGDYIGRREYSAKQIKDKLLQHGFDRQTAENAVQQCIDSSLIDDRRFASAYVYHLYKIKLMPAARIRYELAAAGVDSAIADDEIAAAEIDDIESISALINKKFSGRLNFDSKKDIEKLTSSLARRGFSFADIKCALKNIESETDEYE
ncbi:MAG: recombination regulator RecX [Clostridiales bacterium]|nr:recombination regulator RecX [Clostridiales bacterium]